MADFETQVDGQPVSVNEGAIQKAAPIQQQEDKQQDVGIVSTTEVQKVGHSDQSGNRFDFAIEGGKLIKYVNGLKQVGGYDDSGEVARLEYQAPADVRDQYGWGSNDIPWDVITKLKEMADEAGVPNNLPKVEPQSGKLSENRVEAHSRELGAQSGKLSENRVEAHSRELSEDRVGELRVGLIHEQPLCSKQPTDGGHSDSSADKSSRTERSAQLAPASDDIAMASDDKRQEHAGVVENVTASCSGNNVSVPPGSNAPVLSLAESPQQDPEPTQAGDQVAQVESMQKIVSTSAMQKSASTATEAEPQVCFCMTNPHVFWRHPCARIFIAILILVFDMFLFGEDPVNDSHVECNLPGMGHLLCLFFRWSGSTGSLVLRFCLIVIAVVFGCVFGNYGVHHRFLRNRLRMFEEFKGTWFVMGVTVVPCLFLAIFFHNLIVASDDTITSATGMEMRDFGKLSQCCSVTADLIAIIMVVDAVMQEESGKPESLRYPKWIPGVRHFYSHGLNGLFRVLFVWLVAITCMVLFLWGILNTGKKKDDWRWEDRTIGGLTEVARSFLVTCVIFCDLFTVMQDWEFPNFHHPVDLDPPMIAGTMLVELDCQCAKRCAEMLPSAPECCKKWLPDASFFHITVTGPWLSYGPLLVVLALDLFCMRTQCFYAPSTYGQYVHPSTKRIWTITDQQYLRQAYDKGVLKHKHMIKYEARWDTTSATPLSASAETDIELNSRYLNSAVKYVAIIPGFSFILIFWVMVCIGNLQQSEKRKVHRKVHDLEVACLAPLEYCRGALEDATSFLSGHSGTIRSPETPRSPQLQERQTTPRSGHLLPGQPSSQPSA